MSKTVKAKRRDGGEVFKYKCARCSHAFSPPAWMRGYIKPSRCPKCGSRYIIPR